MKTQQFIIHLSDERSGPRGGKAKPLVTCYTVAAVSQEEALEVFRDECPNMIADTTTVRVIPTLCRVMPTNAFRA